MNRERELNTRRQSGRDGRFRMITICSKLETDDLGHCAACCEIERRVDDHPSMTSSGLQREKQLPFERRIGK